MHDASRASSRPRGGRRRTATRNGRWRRLGALTGFLCWSAGCYASFAGGHDGRSADADAPDVDVPIPDEADGPPPETSPHDAGADHDDGGGGDEAGSEDSVQDVSNDCDPDAPLLAPITPEVVLNLPRDPGLPAYWSTSSHSMGALACGASECAAVLQEYVGYPREGISEHYFIRLSSAGVPLMDPVQLPWDRMVYEPVVVIAGPPYAIVRTVPLEPPFSDLTTDIHFQRFSAAGEAIGAPVMLSDLPGAADFASLVWTGAEYGVMWCESDGTVISPYFVRVSATGDVIGPRIRISDGWASCSAGGLAFAGGEYGATWVHPGTLDPDRTNPNVIKFARISAGGRQIGPEVTVSPIRSNRYELAVVWTGSEYGIWWVDWREDSVELWPDQREEIILSRLSPEGVKIGSDISIARCRYCCRYCGSQNVVWVGGAYLVSWGGYGRSRDPAFFALVRADGSLVGEVIRDLVITPDWTDPWNSVPLLSFGGPGVGMLWTDLRDVPSGGKPQAYFRWLAVCLP